MIYKRVLNIHSFFVFVMNMNITWRISSLLKHISKSRNTYGFGVHSPFLFHFTKFILNEKHRFYVFRNIEQLRSTLKNDPRTISSVDFGTGKTPVRKVSTIARTSLSSPKKLRLLYRIINAYKCKNILELGTSLGVSTAYLATPTHQLRCVSIEGNKQLASLAVDNLSILGVNNVSVIDENIDLCLDDVIGTFETLDFVFIDANHRSIPLNNYFEKCIRNINEHSVIVVDDIHWSKDMYKAWNQIQAHPAVTSTISTYHFGIVFFNTHLTKKHYHMIF